MSPLLPSPANHLRTFVYVNMMTAALLAVLSLLPASLQYSCWLLAGLFAAFPASLPFLEKESATAAVPTAYMRDVLNRLAQNTFTFFEETVTEEHHALPPDQLQLDPPCGAAHHTSPTDIGMYLCALISAEKLQLISVDDMAVRMECTVAALEKLPKWKGLFFNWYDTTTLQTLTPTCISSADCGILAVSLFTCAQGMRTLLPRLSKRHFSLPDRLDTLAKSMQLSLLFDPDANLFHVSYDPENMHPSADHYTLLASEARLLSFVAIMLRQVPLSHWHALGRPCIQETLLSYSGALKEYLMPVLFQFPSRGTLLHSACMAAIRQHKRASLQGAFGISDSGCYAFDPNLQYQYKAFGVTKLSLDSSVQDQVLAPYASLLALTLDLKAAFRNLHKLKLLGLQGSLGMFEALDFHKERTAGNHPRVVRSHMAHHQGMILCAICNALKNNYIANLFSEIPGVQAYQLLMDEPPTRSNLKMRRLIRFPDPPERPYDHLTMRRAQALRFPVDAHILYGGGTTLLMDAQGGGYLARNDLMITRFSSNCSVPSGMRLYIRDSQTGAHWMMTDPNLKNEVHFETAQIRFLHERYQLGCELRIWINPLDGTVLHSVTLENKGQTERLVELCSFLEPELRSRKEKDPLPPQCPFYTTRLGKQGISIIKQASSSDMPLIKLWHTMSSDHQLAMIRLQTDKTGFLGRNRTVYAPRALDFPISALADIIGDVQNPCASLRGQLILSAGGKATVLFATHLAASDDDESMFLEQYASIQSTIRTYNTSLTRALMTANHLGMTNTQQLLASRLTGILSYTHQPFQSAYHSSASHSQSKIEKMGIHCDVPLLVVDCLQLQDPSIARYLLKAHAWLMHNGFRFQLAFVIPRSRKSNVIEEEIDIHQDHVPSEDILVFERLSDEEQEILRSTARVVLHAGPESLENQLDAFTTDVQPIQLYSIYSNERRKSVLPKGENVLFENGYGGFTQSDGNYQIALSPGRQTPDRWCNLLCSSHFATLAGESGLLPHCTDNPTKGIKPNIFPPSSEVFYLRDEEKRLLWSLTRAPLGYAMPVRITHAPGETLYEAAQYGIYSRLHCFSDMQACCSIRIVQLRNNDEAPRTLTLFHTCSFDFPSATSSFSGESTADGILIRQPVLNRTIGILPVDPQQTTAYFMSSGSFHGLWGIAPFALCCREQLSSEGGNTAVLASQVTLLPGECRTFISALCSGENSQDVFKLLEQLKNDGARSRLQNVRRYWEKQLGIFHFDLPSKVLSLMTNRWLPYQLHASRLLMDEDSGQPNIVIPEIEHLQALLFIAHTHPEEVRTHLLKWAREHHELNDGYLRSTHLLYLVFAILGYVEITGEADLWEVQPFKPQSAPEVPAEPKRAHAQAGLLNHFIDALSTMETGAHGLPITSTNGGTSENVFHGMLFCELLRQLAAYCDETSKKHLLAQRKQLLSSIERFAWDGHWYLSAWASDGQPIGSVDLHERKIDLLPQCFSVFCGASRKQSEQAMESVWQLLYENRSQPSGSRKTQIHYTYETCMAIAAYQQLGQTERAWKLAERLLPPLRSATQQLACQYRSEPYALAGQVLTSPHLRGRGFQTWPTESAGGYLLVLLTQLLGFQKKGRELRLRPCVPESWESFSITYRYGSATYHLHARRNCLFAAIDGSPLPDGSLRLTDDGKIHEAVFPLR